MSSNNTSMVSTMFEEIKHGIKGIENKINALEQKSTAPGNDNLSTLPAVESKLDELTGQMLPVLHQIEATVKEPAIQRHRHRHTIDIKSSWTVIFIAGLCATVLLLIFFAGWQWRVINRCADSDIKYRYIKMTDGIGPGKLRELETLFEYERDDRAVKALRQQVEDYERALKEQAQKLEQARLKEQEAERLRKEAGELNPKAEK